jgi:hypothetical protein
MSQLPEHMSQRLITQNLLVSATSHERQGATNWQAVRDLSVFIEAFCLYDEIVMLGRQAYSMLLPNRSDIVSAAKETIQIRGAVPDRKLVGAACGHLGAFLNEKIEVSRYQQLVESLLEPRSVDRAFNIRPDGPDDFQQGMEWLRTIPDELDILVALDQDKEFHRGTTFLVRTFLYLAYADIHRLPLTPDQTRTRVFEPIVRSERNLRKMLLDKLEREFQKNYFANDISIKRNITPLASVVFDRAYPKPENIAKEMVELRYELAPLRERIGKAEKTLVEGTRMDELSVARKWNEVFQEIERAYGTGQGLLRMRGLLTFAEPAVAIAGDPTSLNSWAKILKLPIDALSRMVSRLPVIEIYNTQFPSSERLQRAAHRLFGEISEAPE